jgi:hypothetical protein
MKFQVREGFVCKLINKIDLGNDKFELQENTIYGGQVVDLTTEQADAHAHKLDPKDKAAEAYLAAKVAPVSAPAGVSAEHLALVQAMAAEMAKAIVASLQDAIKPAVPPAKA